MRIASDTGRGTAVPRPGDRAAGSGPLTLSVRPIEDLQIAAADVIRLAGELPRAVVLAGGWDAGQMLLAADPIAVSTGAEPAFGLLDTLQPIDDDTGAVGGGWFGWFGVEDGAHALGLYPHVVRFAAGRWWDEALCGLVDDAELERRRAALVAALGRGPQQPQAYTVGRVTSRRDRRAHSEAVERCIHEIRDGDIYQANICLTLEAEVDGSTAGLAAALIGTLQPAYGAYVGIDDGVVASASPELFLRRRGQTVVSRPIKGTRPRVGGAAETLAREALAHSTKDRAENVMIVDLVRSDLSRVARIGSVRVPHLLEVVPHPGVWHLVSEVTAELRPGAGDADLLAATFPPGSVTGAPKRRALEVIAELEDGPRGVYTGTIGYASPVAGLELSVAIRTLQVGDGRLRLGVGGGITVDSTPVEEWWECFDKARPLLAAIGGDLVVPDAGRPGGDDGLAAAGIFDTCLRRDGRPLEVAEHRARLERSLHELYRLSLPAAAAEALEPEDGVAGWQRQRIDVMPGGDVRVTRVAVGPPLALADQDPAQLVTVPGSGFGRHKWADRSRQEALEAAYGDRVPVHADASGRLLESTRANVIGVRGSTLVTAPLEGGILPGVTRTVVLDLARELGLAIELQAPDPAEVDALALAGSVAGLRWVSRCDDRTYPGPGPALSALARRLLERWHAGATVGP